MISRPMLSPRKVWAIPRLARTVGTTIPTFSSHYDALGLTPKATQGDIKSAYYKLSMLYHPDKATNNADSAKKFRAITEAYEVLKDIKLKKMYDKGLMTGRENTSRMDYQPDPEPTDPTLKFYKSRTQRHVMPTMDGKKPIYDFDSWSKNHYGTMLKNKQYEKELLKRRGVKRSEADVSVYQETYLYMIFAMVGMFIVMVANGRADYDQVEPVQNENEQKKKTQINVVSNTK